MTKRPMWYVLDENKNPVPTNNINDIAIYYSDNHRRRVGLDVINGVTVSTVFLCIDHNWYDEGPPILFETMVFCNDEAEEEQWRYSTWKAAEEGHKKICECVRKSQKPKDIAWKPFWK